MIVGIAGGTASGKTTIARLAAERLGATLLAHDRYYLDAHAHTNFDHPDALETARLVEDLDRLRAGLVAEVPVYAFATHTRAGFEPIRPSPVVIVEGILALSDPDLRARFDLAVFVRCAADVRLIRRVRRDVAERGRTVESVFAQYLATVRPMHDRFVEPTAGFAQLVLDGEGEVEGEVGRLVERVGGR